MSRLRSSDKEPSLHDAAWREFCLAKEDNSAHASKNWARYRQGLRRLEQRHSPRVPAEALRLELAEDVFFCATHWQQTPRIVRAALRDLLDFRLSPKRYSFVAVEFWKWSTKASPADLNQAKQMVSQARAALHKVDPRDRANLKRMFEVVVDDGNVHLE